jgi:hypothetical protein
MVCTMGFSCCQQRVNDEEILKHHHLLSFCF